MKKILLLSAISLSFSVFAATDILIVAHRGASYDAPENTLASNRLAWEQNADAVETDIHLTKDKKIIVLHDKNTKRRTGHDALIANLTLTELRTLDAGSWKAPQFAGEKMPTLEEQIMLIPPGKRMFVEIKGDPEIVPVLASCLKKCKAGTHNITIISFNYKSLKAVRKQLPELSAYYLSAYPKHQGQKTDGPPPIIPDLDEIIAKAKAANLTGLSLQHRWPLTAGDVRKIKDAGLELHVWTVNDPEIAQRWITLGAQSITTDRPGWLREQLGLKQK